MESINPYVAPQLDAYAEAPPRPRGSFASILHTGIWLYVNNFPAVAAVTLIVWSPLELYLAYMEYFVFEADDLRSYFRLQQILEGLFGIIATGGVTAIGAAAMRAEPMSWWEGLKQGLLAWPRLFWTRIVLGFLLVLAFFALVIPGFYLFVRLALSDQVAVIEKRSGMDCIKRSFELTKGAFWRLSGLMLLVMLAIIVGGAVVAVPSIVLPDSDHWLMSAATSLIADLLMPLMALVLVAAYFAGLDEKQPNPESSEPAPAPSSADRTM